jgi:polar amino acid transport system substrate-binding protein
MFRIALVLLSSFLLVGQLSAQVSLKSIQKKGEIRIGMTGVQPPYSLESIDGDLMGFEVDLAQILAKAMNVECVLVKMPFQELLPTLQEGEIDAVMSGLTMTVERNLKNVFIGPYAVTGKTLLTKTSVIDRINTSTLYDTKDLSLVALKGTTSEDFITNYIPEADVKYLQNYDEAVKMVIDGRVDALVADYPICALSALRHQGKGLVCLEEPVTIEPIGMAINTTDPVLINIIQNYFNTLQLSGNLDLITYKWFDDSTWLLRAKL